MHKLKLIGRSGNLFRHFEFTKLALASVFFLGFQFEAAQSQTPCARPSQSVRLSFVGDILVHQALFEHSTRSRDRFTSLWKSLIPTFKDADLMVGNLEGPVAPGRSLSGPTADPGFRHDGKVYSGTNFVFNYHPYLLDDLKASGFDLLSTANNHTMDRGSAGVRATLHQIQSRRIFAVGTRDSQTAQDYIQRLRIRDTQVAFIACAENLNGFRDKAGLVLLCSSNLVIQLIKESQARGDFTILLPHWGYEYQTQPNSQQRRWAKSWINAGADAIIGSHPHVLQTTEWLTTPEGQQAVVVYSLGNFVAAQKDIRRRASAIFHLDIGPASSGHIVRGAHYTPILRPTGSYATRLADPEKHRAEISVIREQLGPQRCKLN